MHRSQMTQAERARARANRSRFDGVERTRDGRTVYKFKGGGADAHDRVTNFSSGAEIETTVRYGSDFRGAAHVQTNHDD